MSKLALIEIQHQKIKQLLANTYPTGENLKADTSGIPVESGRAIKDVQNKLEASRESIRYAEDVLEVTDIF